MRGLLEEKSGDKSATTMRDFKMSLFVMALLIGFALAGLARDENWRKLVRVLIGFSAYLVVLLSALGVYSSMRKQRGVSLPFPAFALSGAAAEISSGWLRPGAKASVDLWTALAAALLIGGVHWLALRAARSLHERIVRTERGSIA
jgi:hypothetical protein